MTQSSFYGDTPNFATDFPTQNDGNTQPADGNVQSPSSFYPNGGIYAFLNSSDPLLVQLQALADATRSDAADAATSAANAAASEATVLAGIAGAAGTAAPIVDGTATVGASTKWAHEDHVHPTDTSRASVTALSAAVAPKADKTYVDAQDAIGIAHTDSVVAPKADKTYVDAQDAIGIAHTDTAVAPKADKTYVDAQDATKANIASPTFTGTPQAPTPSAGDASTKLATTQFVATATAVQTGAPLKVQQTVDTTNRSISSTTDVATGSISSAITPQSSSNKLRVQVSGIIGASTTIGVHTKLYRSINGGTYTDITPAGMTDMQGQVVNSATFPVPFNLDFIDSPATNLPVTYQLFMSVTSAATAFLGRRGGDTVFSSPTIFTVTEIKG